jgi:Flp pilus assembly protein TadB
MKKVLDLRNKDKASSPKPQRAREVINKNTRAIRWDAPSFYFNPRKRYLLFTIAGIITACGVLVFYYYDILTALFLIMTAVVIVLSSNKKPYKEQESLTQKAPTVPPLWL